MSYFYDLKYFADNVAIINDRRNKYTYANLNEFCRDLKSNISFASKKLLFVLCENSIETIVAYLACLQANTVVTLLDAKINKSLLKNLIITYSPDFIWLPKQNKYNAKFIFGNYELVALQSKKTKEIHPDLSLLLSTSGSTGSPKMIKLSKKNLQANALSISQYLGINEQDRAITSLPLHYSYGLSVINSHLLVGATILLTNQSVVTKQFWEFYKAEKASSFSGVPYTYEILKKINFFNMRLNTLRYMTQAGGKLNPDLTLEYSKFSRERGFEFYVMYGQTEATARIAYLPPEKNLEKYDCIGIPIPDGKICLIDKNGNNINEPYQEGELIYRGPNVMMGYAESRDELERGDELQGLLKTGDLAYVDEDGYFYIKGRLKRFLKIHGNRVDVILIENYLTKLGFQCYCGGEDDRLIVANLHPEHSKKIQKYVIKRFGFHHSVVDVIEIEKVPRNEYGKILYNDLFKGLLGN